MKISIFGTGYVGLVTAACLAEVGHYVYGVDIDQNKIDDLNNGIVPIFESGLEKIIKRNSSSSRLKFTTNAELAINQSNIIMLAVGTPTDLDGSADMKYVSEVAKTIGSIMVDSKIIVIKSTVPVGTSNLVKKIINKKLSDRDLDISFNIASNPEFLKEGDAVNDFMKPDRIILGCDDEETEKKLRMIYAPFHRSHDRCIVMDVKSAELTKYASNAMLATKISFMNELSQIAERVDADIESVRDGIGSDSRIGHSFIYPGIGFGGSCFPKDIRALISTARKNNYEPKILNAIEEVNQKQKILLVEKILNYYDGNIEGLKFSLWGLSFKPNTDDIREAPSKVIIDALLENGANISAYDPEAMDNMRKEYSGQKNLYFSDNNMEALTDANCLIIATEWKNFLYPDFSAMKLMLKDPIIFDGRNIYDPKELERLGFIYHGIGRSKNIIS